MKMVYFVRHAKSSWADPMLGDEQRPLNERGKRDALALSEMMVMKEVAPDLIITSTAKRARATARQFRKAFDLAKDSMWRDSRMYLASTKMMVNVVKELPKDYTVVWLFGHNPGMTDLANTFANRYIENVPTCGIVKVEADIDDWAAFSQYNARMTQFYYPKLFV